MRSDLDDMVVGNIHDNTLQEIAKSERTWNIIQGFFDGQRPETCRGCTIYNPVNRKWLEARISAQVSQADLQVKSD